MIRLGVDPGDSSGAAALLSAPGAGRAFVCAVLAWSPGESDGDRDLRVYSNGTLHRLQPGAFPEFARTWLHNLRTHPINGVSVEEPISGHHRGAGAVSTVTHAAASWWRGLIFGVLDHEAARPLAQTWRRDVLSLPSSLKSRQADAQIARLIPARVELPAGIPKWAMKHLPDACGVALWVPR